MVPQIIPMWTATENACELPCDVTVSNPGKGIIYARWLRLQSALTGMSGIMIITLSFLFWKQIQISIFTH